MGVLIEKYNHLTRRLLDATFDLDGGSFKVMLVSSGYVFNAAHISLADVSAHEISGSGYSAGGAALSNVSLTTSGSLATWDADDVIWPESTITARRAIVYREGTYDALVNPLLFSILLDDTPDDISSLNSSFILQWNANGILTL